MVFIHKYPIILAIYRVKFTESEEKLCAWHSENYCVRSNEQFLITDFMEIGVMRNKFNLNLNCDPLVKDN